MENVLKSYLCDSKYVCPQNGKLYYIIYDEFPVCHPLHNFEQIDQTDSSTPLPSLSFSFLEPRKHVVDGISINCNAISTQIRWVTVYPCCFFLFTFHAVKAFFALHKSRNGRLNTEVVINLWEKLLRVQHTAISKIHQNREVFSKALL